MCRVGAFKAARSAQVDGGIKGADGDADLRVGRGGAALGGGNVGTALEQLRRHAEREPWAEARSSGEAEC
jgi:hypothetical protein